MENKKNKDDKVIKMCSKYHKCSSCPMNRKCEEELKELEERRK